MKTKLLNGIDCIVSESKEPRCVLFDFMAGMILKHMNGGITKTLMDEVVDELFVRVDKLRIEEQLKREIDEFELKRFLDDC